MFLPSIPEGNVFFSTPAYVPQPWVIFPTGAPRRAQFLGIAAGQQHAHARSHPRTCICIAQHLMYVTIACRRAELLNWARARTQPRCLLNNRMHFTVEKLALGSSSLRGIPLDTETFPPHEIFCEPDAQRSRGQDVVSTSSLSPPPPPNIWLPALAFIATPLFPHRPFPDSSASSCRSSDHGTSM